METLPREVREQQCYSAQLPVPKFSNPIHKNADNSTDTPSRIDLEPVTRTQRLQVKGWEYVPHYDNSPQNISSKIDKENILEDSRRLTRRSNQAFLMDVVLYSKAIGDTQERENGRMR
ncbi:hypothetical protein O181_078536 [Austropuccinia psidii MF-1]|uniref:Uncharacterized protein n=1 Tax=Austropuccinia psidii MF-1 TaxID=1389203 RepID=A0A9Q3FK66_9BASI|nr:hypothetical protein [Austropuccinia psidii MF-1]